MKKAKDYASCVEDYKQLYAEQKKNAKLFEKVLTARTDFVLNQFLEELEAGRWPKLLNGMIKHGYNPEKHDYEKHQGWLTAYEEDCFTISISMTSDDCDFGLEYTMDESVPRVFSNENGKLHFEDIRDSICFIVDDVPDESPLAQKLTDALEPFGELGIEFEADYDMADSYQVFFQLLDTLEKEVL